MLFLKYIPCFHCQFLWFIITIYNSNTHIINWIFIF